MRTSSEMNNETYQVLKEKPFNFRGDYEQDDRDNTANYPAVNKNDLILNLNKRKSIRFEKVMQIARSNTKKLEPEIFEEKKLKLNEKNDNHDLNKNIIENILDDNVTITIMSTLTIYILFENDINQILSPSTDFAFNLATAIAISLFAIEFILCCFVREFYIFSFFFWIDFLSIISTLSDIQFIIDPLLESLTR